MTASSRNSVFYQQFLQQVEDANPAGNIWIVTGNLSSHNSLSTRTWLEDHPRIHHAFISLGACWLNLQEGWWRIFRKAALAGRSFTNPDDIAYATVLATSQLNSRAKAVRSSGSTCTVRASSRAPRNMGTSRPSRSALWTTCAAPRPGGPCPTVLRPLAVPRPARSPGRWRSSRLACRACAASPCGTRGLR
ncbi:hypothetical protein [Streptomyces adustus]